MRFALLGADAAALALARAVRDSSQHELVWFHVPRTAWSEIAEIAPGIAPAEQWESLLSGIVADAVIVGRGEDDDQRTEQLTRLAQAGVPALVSHPVQRSMLAYYEIDAVRREQHTSIVPHLPWRFHPAFARLTALCDPRGEQPLGTLEQLVIERSLHERTKARVTAQFAVDVDLARVLCGELTHLGALAPGATAYDQDPQYANIGVQAFGPAGVMFRWSAGPIENQAGARLSLSASHGKATLDMPEGDRHWRLEIRRRHPDSGELDRASQVEEFPVWNPAAWSLEQFIRSLAVSGTALAAGGTRVGVATPVRPDWTDALKAVELAEAIDRSLIRRRTIEVRQEDTSESGAFKGTMATVGCGLLLLSLPLFVLGVILGNKPIEAIFAGRLLIYFSVGLLFLFLLLQGLSVFVRRDPPQPPDTQA